MIAHSLPSYFVIWTLSPLHQPRSFGPLCRQPPGSCSAALPRYRLHPSIHLRNGTQPVPGPRAVPGMGSGDIRPLLM